MATMADPIRSESRTGSPHRASGGRRASGYTLILGVLTMIAGAIVHFSTGTDLWAALAADSIGDHLAAVAGAEGVHYLGLTLWSVGAILLGLGGAGLAGTGAGAGADMARASYAIGASLAVASFLLMASVVRIADGGGDAAIAAEGLGFAGAHLDDVATAVIIGLSPVLLALSGTAGALSKWLARLAWGCGAAALVMVAAIFVDATATWGLVIVPIGLGWTLAAGILAVRRGG